METIGERIEAVLKELDIPRAELARRIGKFPGYVSTLINENRNPRTTSLIMIARALGVEMQWLAAGIGPKRTSATPAPDETNRVDKKEGSEDAPTSDRAHEPAPQRATAPARRPTVGTFTPDDEEEAYPNLTRAIETARGLGVPEEVLQRVATVRLKSDHDLSFEQWMEFIRQEYWQYKNGIERETPEEETDRTLREMMEGSTGSLVEDARKRAAEYDAEVAEEQAKRGK